MRTDKYGQIIYDEKDLIDLYYRDPEINLKRVLVEKNIHFDSSLELENKPELVVYKDIDQTVALFDNQKQQDWFMPSEYKDLDIAKFVLDQCQGEVELQRAGMELLMYQERGMFPLLRYLKYLVDTMRQHNIVWGVGRGSSVASFVLFIIGVHRINSIIYDLPIEEFLK